MRRVRGATRLRGPSRLLTEARDENGSMAVEIVVLVPVLLALMMLVVALGRYVSAEGAAAGAAREAVRAASVERDQAAAAAAARNAAADSLPAGLTCQPAQLSGAFVAGGTITVRVSCQVSWSSLGLIGLGGTAGVERSSSAPLDVYRRAGP